MTKLSCSWWLVGVCAIAVGCGSTSATPDAKTIDATPDAGKTATQACADDSVAECMLRSTCSNMFEIQHLYGSITTCESRLAQACTNALGAPGTAQTPNGIEACSQAYATDPCSNFYDADPPTACVPPAGPGATTTPCGNDAQCASAFCAVSQFDVCGTCQPEPIAGATCTVDGDCGRDLGCAIAGGATTGTCQAWVAASGACLTGTSICGAGLACVDETVASSTPGTCQAQGTTVNAPCDTSRKTEANCNPNLGLVCIPVTGNIGTCQMITLAAANAPCGEIGVPETGFAECTSGLCKKAVATDVSGTCVADVADGTACNSDVTIGPSCLSPAKCVPTVAGMTAGTCTLPNAASCN